MNCSSFEQIWVRFLEGSLAPEERRELESHLRECQHCRRLERIARGDLDLLPPADRPDLARAILERTSGRACRRTLDLACDLVDGMLEEGDRQLVSLHLEHCTSCAALVGTLEELKLSLPAMAQLEPPPGFTAAVLGATTTCSDRQRDFAAGFMDRLRAWARQPRFTLEAAYIGTLLLVAVLGNPTTVVNKTSPYVLSMVQVNLRGAWKSAVQYVPPAAVDFGFAAIGEVRRVAGQLYQTGAATTQRLGPFLRGDEDFWKAALAPAVGPVRTFLESAASEIQTAGRGLLGEDAR